MPSDNEDDTKKVQDTNTNSTPPPKAYVFKQLEKISSPSKTYNIYDYENIVYTQANRPDQTLDNFLESQLSKRMKKFLPTNLDLVDYDKELLKK
jgi:hypothetical protein